MRDITFSRSRYNITWISMLVIFMGTIVYPVVLEHAKERNYKQSVQPIISYALPHTDVKPIPTKTTSISSTPKPVAKAHLLFVRDLKVGDRGSDVKKLQEYLNQRGFLVSLSGNGSLGHETELFGPGTASALKRFQESYADILLKPYGLSEGTGFFGEATRNFINS